MELQVARNAQVEVERLLLEHDADVRERAPRVGAHRQARHLDLARIGGEQAGQHLEQRGLAGAVRAEQHGEAAARDRQAERIERHALAVALGEAAHLQHGAPSQADSRREFSSLR